MKQQINNKNYLSWKTYDEYLNIEEMWPKDIYKDAAYSYVKDIGCYVVSLSIMMRLFGIVETSFEQFNPLILCNKLKAINAFSLDGSVNVEKLQEAYPLKLIDSIPYSKMSLDDSIRQGYACQIIVKGKKRPQHYVVPLKILEKDVEIIDPTEDRKYISETEPLWIARYIKV